MARLRELGIDRLAETFQRTGPTVWFTVDENGWRTAHASRVALRQIPADQILKRRVLHLGLETFGIQVQLLPDFLDFLIIQLIVILEKSVVEKPKLLLVIDRQSRAPRSMAYALRSLQMRQPDVRGLLVNIIYFCKKNAVAPSSAASLFLSL